MFQALGPVVPAADLVEASFEEEPRGERLAARFLVGSDGSRELSSIRDTALDKNCSPTDVGPAERRCVPSEDLAYSFQSRFADAGCTEEVAYDPREGASCPAAKVVLKFEDLGCGYDPPTLHEIGDPGFFEVVIP